jgi:hypothetical protein
MMSRNHDDQTPRSVPTPEKELMRRRTRKSEVREAHKAIIAKFAEKQRKFRKWICFAEIADWAAREVNSIKPSEELRARAYMELRASLVAGDFDLADRTNVLFLSPDIPGRRMTLEFFDRAARSFDDRIVVDGYLKYCWIPRELCHQWFNHHRLSCPIHFEPPGEREVLSAEPEQSAQQAVLSGDQAARKTNKVLMAAIESRLDSGKRPALTETWKHFCSEIRDATGGWKDKAYDKSTWGFGDKTIQGIVREIQARRNEQDA